MKVKEICSKLLSLKKSDYIVLVLLGLLILIVAVPAGNTKNGKKKNSESTFADNQIKENDDYGADMEEKLEDILGEINGVGKVKVMITLSDEGSADLDKDIKRSTEYTQTNTVIYDSDGEKRPYVTSMKKPKVEGVLVVAQGGGTPSVDSNISDAVQALFNIEAHKIRIAKMLSEDEKQ